MNYLNIQDEQCKHKVMHTCSARDSAVKPGSLPLFRMCSSWSTSARVVVSSREIVTVLTSKGLKFTPWSVACLQMRAASLTSTLTVSKKGFWPTFRPAFLAPARSQAGQD